MEAQIPIVKRAWTHEEYEQWFAGLETKRTPTSTPQNLYEIEHAGELNYFIRGGGAEFWTDGISESTVLEAKLIVNASRSPYLEGSQAPDFVRRKALEDVRGELRRVSMILRDAGNPLTSMRVITNDMRAVPLFAWLLREYNIPGEVVVRL